MSVVCIFRLKSGRELRADIGANTPDDVAEKLSANKGKIIVVTEQTVDGTGAVNGQRPNMLAVDEVETALPLV